jgi:hypothetical protein
MSDFLITMTLAALVVATPAIALEGDPPGFPDDLADFSSACKRLANHNNPDPESSKMLLNRCVQDEEEEARDASKYLWTLLPPDMQTYCAIYAQINGNNLVKYQTMHACLEQLASSQHEVGGELPLSYRKGLLDSAIRALKVGHF